MKKNEPKSFFFLLLGIVFLIIGYAFYILVRDPGSTYLSLISFGQKKLLFIAPVIASWPWIDSFPSFLHTAAFSFISLGLLKRVSRSGLLIPFFWLVVNLGFEFGQRYSGFGYFDWNDILASIAGCILVTAMLSAILQKRYSGEISSLSYSIKYLRTALKISVVSVGFLSIVATSSSDERYEPVYMTYEELRQPISGKEPQDLNKLGKIYIYKEYLLVNYPNTGIHIFDNTDPAHPINLIFLNIPGNVDIAVKDDVLYADSYIDLVAFDLLDINDVHEIKRVQNVFPYNPYQSIPEGIYLIRVCV